MAEEKEEITLDNIDRIVDERIKGCYAEAELSAAIVAKQREELMKRSFKVEIPKEEEPKVEPKPKPKVVEQPKVVNRRSYEEIFKKIATSFGFKVRREEDNLFSAYDDTFYFITGDGSKRKLERIVAQLGHNGLTTCCTRFVSDPDGKMIVDRCPRPCGSRLFDLDKEVEALKETFAQLTLSRKNALLGFKAPRERSSHGRMGWSG